MELKEMFKSDSFHLTTGNLDEFDRLRPYAILDLFQEMACNHAEEIGVGYEAMLSKGYYWIITKNKYIINKYPKPSETVQVQTWPIAPGRADFDRAYQILSLDGEVLVEGRSKWCVIDNTTRKIIRSDKVDFNGKYIDRDLQVVFERGNLLNKNDLEFMFDYTVRPSMLDHYHHMNNAKYAEVVLDALELTSDQLIEELQINNFNEVKCQEVIKVYKKIIDNYVHIYGYTLNNDEYDKLAFNAIVKIN